MAAIRIAINGFGRIGRAVFKIARERPDMEIVAINDLADSDTLAYLLAHDSTYGAYGYPVTAESGALNVDGVTYRVLTQPSPHALPWDGMDIDVVIEATGAFASVQQSQAHIRSGAKKVIVTAALKGSGEYAIAGVNEPANSTECDVISMGSCTANAVAPVIKILAESIGIDSVLITNIHSATNDQSVLDSVYAGRQVAVRAALGNIIPIPSNTGRIVGQLLPDCQRVQANGYRVPTANVAIAELACITSRATDADELNTLLRQAAEQPYYKGIIGLSDTQLVSSDYNGDARSGVIDLTRTQVAGDRLARVAVWYDNEWGYANRVVELAADMGRAR